MASHDIGRRDVVVVGGGHNSLVAATLLARAGLSVVILEQQEAVGGAAVSGHRFEGVDVSVSPYAYLVSLFPDALAAALGVDLRLLRRHIASCTPVGGEALVVDNLDAETTSRSFSAAGLDKEFDHWSSWQTVMRRVAVAVAPTLMEPLRPASFFRDLLGAETWELLTARPLGDGLGDFFRSDLVQGLVLTDGLIGTFAPSRDTSLRHNRCFLYHVIGNGTGDWRVPVGGMGALTGTLAHAALRDGVEVHTRRRVVGIDGDGTTVQVVTEAGDRYRAAVALWGAAPLLLQRLMPAGVPASEPEGAQVKLDMVVRRLPRLACAVPPETAFAGTLHVNERLTQLDAAWEQGRSGSLPSPVPCEVYCHSLTDPSVVGPQLRSAGIHTLGLFALQTPARVFNGPQATARERAVEACLDSLQSVLAEPLLDCILPDASGNPCIEAHTPADLIDELGLPGGNIFHGELRWPWAETDEEAGLWGVETAVDNVFLCGSGARRGGGVSGLGGHNAAMATLAHLRRTRR
jgi:phytoene dehydrogenase-like protein